MNNQISASQAPVNVAVFLLGIFYLSTSYAFYNLNHYKLLVALCGGLLLLVLLWGGNALSTKRQASSAQHNTSLLFLLVCLVPLFATLPGLIATAGRHTYFFGQEMALWLICCAWMLLLIRLLDDTEKLALFLLSLAVIVAAIALAALWNSIGQAADSQSAQINRESGTFGNPNFLACFLVMHIPLFGLCAATSWQSVPSWRARVHVRLIFLVAALLSLLALFFTQSRVAMATLVAILGGLALLVICMPGFAQSARKAGGLLIAVPLAAIAIAALLFPELLQSMTSELRSTPESRLVPWRAAWASIEDAPWLGWGAGSSYSLFFQYVDPASRLLWQERSYAHPHNEVLEILQEGGVLGLIGYGVFIGMVLLAALRLLRDRNVQYDYKVITVGAMCALFAYHIAGMASVDTRMAVVRLGLFTLLALMFALKNIAASEAASGQRDAPLVMAKGTSRVSTFATVLALLAVSAALLKEDLASRHRYVSIMQLADGASKEQLLEDLRDESPNVYALEQLVQMQIASRDFSGAAITLEKLEALIPNYSISGYFRATSYLLQNREEDARSAALAYQQRDHYFPRNAHLLMKIAVMREEPELFLQQLELLLTPVLIQNVRLRGIGADNVIVTSSNGATSCVLDRQHEVVHGFVLAINADVVIDMMARIKAAFQGTSPDTAADYHNYLAAGVRNLICEGFSESEAEILHVALQQMLTTAAAPTL